MAESVKKLLGSRSLANRSGAGHKARRRVVGQLFSSAALARYTPSIIGLVDELADELINCRWPGALGRPHAPLCLCRDRHHGAGPR